MTPTRNTSPAAIFFYPGRRPMAGARAALRAAGRRLMEPADEAEALSVLPELRADLYLVEAHTGAEARGALAGLATHRPAGDSPWLVLGGPGLAATDVPELYARGATDVLPAPFDPTLLVAKVDALLRWKRELDQARELSMRDALTGLYNRRFFQERLEQEIARAMRTRQGLALLLVDVDHFKKVNDTFGHPVGDAVLRGLADTATRHTRRSDIVARVGGDEFAMLLTSNNAEGARVCAEGLRRRLLDTPYEAPVEARVSVSIGIAAWPSTLVFRPVEDLVRVADEALLRAKALGRDRVAVAGEE